MKLLMLAGAGSVGKTALMNACKEMAEARGLRVQLHYSSTRETYARHGLTNESDALKDPEFNASFQHVVMTDNIRELLTTASAAYRSREIDLFITDRSPYDYSGYYYTVFQSMLTLDIIHEKRLTCDQAIVSLAAVTDDIDVIMLPYPTSWAKDTESSDGWRADKTGKNFLWSCAVEAELNDAERRLKNRVHAIAPTKVSISRLPSFMERGSVEARAVGALSMIYPDLR
jgi:hypothetical protein